jgi:CHASE3 domain sensor protein
MLEKLVKFLREYVLVFSGICIIVGLFFFLIGMFWWWVRNLLENANSPLHLFSALEYGNTYLLVFGLIVLGIGLYYVYSFLKKRKFVVDEIKTNKRSELLKKRRELESTVKHLPSKYQRMLEEKEEELNIK